MINVAILGSTGSIGTSTLDVISRQSDRFNAFALTANKNVERLYEQCLQFLPEIALMVDKVSAKELEQRLQSNPETQHINVFSGCQALDDVAAAEQVDYVMAAIVGAAGLSSSLAAARSGKRILLANKESLVMSGDLFMQAVKENGATLLPVDSEHNAIFQVMPDKLNNISVNVDSHINKIESPNLQDAGIGKILLTASGGPFLNKSLTELQDVTPDQACAHPTWEMGRKISVDSATMMNKGLEVIEASWLFNASADDIQVVIHPQSVIHSMVSYSDGSVLAQLGNPDMRTPIAHAMAWPERMTSGVEPLDIFKVAQLNFEQPDFERFVCLKLAYDALRAGGTAPAILNAANEIAVDAFLQEKITFTQIAEVVQRTIEQLETVPADSLDVILNADARARSVAASLCDEMI
ncbi:MAG: 1-deoxy-D-xylulose-5-phosphate reductoisomerase [gamma proteobacterium symbiont of Bathyaustriella thionipta]|nr:1-deoxy-D-xylulose-5-phosphate reductoisomerase [gamma proteobacterium symbiont of Bathyaustriella thionipta]MCU7948581.1 1-deoxy-D-xylulose-5-phosphate reductoisomerase [gamma proteobacterium symbiont of Bathyaustriella thionipta]MCU7953298.1 1-deoxy-D-xylulose-5-phosphate reductoisomerase [gamma proteobacterium symbiont of Bathyaustriella thionipta]MCU7955087.1 1-deoxy-D-xylulose-5-phosphate reductoisomerase [gamma proteobacterium symbiont of Bathyaustriella thionipta]MCU7967017.1 1-deoxy-